MIRRRGAFGFNRQRQIYHNGGLAFEHADALGAARDAIQAGAQFVVSVGTKSAEPELTVFLDDIRTNLETLQVLKENNRTRHGMAEAVENPTLDRTGNGRRSTLLTGGAERKNGTGECNR